MHIKVNRVFFDKLCINQNKKLLRGFALIINPTMLCFLQIKDTFFKTKQILLLLLKVN